MRHPTAIPLPPPIADYLRDIAPLDLAALLDEHLHTMIRLCAASGEPVSEEQASAYHHIRRLRDLFVQLSAKASGDGGELSHRKPSTP